MTIWYFLLRFFRIKGRGLYFDQFKFFCEGVSSQYKKLIELPNNRVGHIVQRFNYVEDAFILEEEKANKEAKPIAGILFYLQSQVAG